MGKTVKDFFFLVGAMWWIACAMLVIADVKYHWHKWMILLKDINGIKCRNCFEEREKKKVESKADEQDTSP